MRFSIISLILAAAASVSAWDIQAFEGKTCGKLVQDIRDAKISGCQKFDSKVPIQSVKSTYAGNPVPVFFTTDNCEGSGFKAESGVCAHTDAAWKSWKLVGI